MIDSLFLTVSSQVKNKFSCNSVVSFLLYFIYFVISWRYSIVKVTLLRERKKIENVQRSASSSAFTQQQLVRFGSALVYFDGGRPLCFAALPRPDVQTDQHRYIIWQWIPPFLFPLCKLLLYRARPVIYNSPTALHLLVCIKQTAKLSIILFRVLSKCGFRTEIKKNLQLGAICACEIKMYQCARRFFHSTIFSLVIDNRLPLWCLDLLLCSVEKQFE